MAHTDEEDFDSVDTESQDKSPLLSAISVEELFGRYTYKIDFPSHDSQLLILYGDNGSGKTTLLRLLWNLLSPSDSRGHRTFLAQTPFRRFSTHFSDGSSIVVTKRSDLLGDFEVNLARPDAPDLVATYETDEHHRVKKSGFKDFVAHFGDDPDEIVLLNDFEYSDIEGDKAREEFLHFLSEMGISPLMLADDRSLYSDDLELERARERRTRPNERKRSNRPGSQEDALAELKVTVSRVDNLLRTLMLSGQNVGSAGANTIYAQVLRQLASLDESEQSHDGDESTHATRLLHELAERSPRYEEFDLVPHFDAPKFMALLREIGSSRQALAYDILAPYLDSLRARYDALSSAEKLLRSLISLMNDFLTDKKLTFSPRRGLGVVTDTGSRLTWSSLSSGERQLMMLLSTTVLARRDSRLFIIDEPELSLGVTWQRRIIDALLALIDGTGLQFIIATHSVELISGHPEALAKLERR